MPTNANTYNSRVTDEALEKKFRDSFKSQGGAELVDDLFASGVIVPTIDFTSAVGGGDIAENLQTAWDFATEHTLVRSATPVTIINTTGFWKIDLVYAGLGANTGASLSSAVLDIYDGATAKEIWQYSNSTSASVITRTVTENTFVAYVRSGDSIRFKCQDANQSCNIWYRQIADINGNLTNPLGFTSS